VGRCELNGFGDRCMRPVRCTHCLRAMPMPLTIDGEFPTLAGRCESCSGPLAPARVCRAGTGRVSTPIRARLLYRARIVAEMWYAWRTSHEMLRWYQRVSIAEPRLTGGSLYEEVIVRRSGLDIEAASGLLQRARQSFCEWPGPRKLRYRDVVHYVVVDEYMRSHLTDFRGTYTNMRRVVAGVIPYHL
jgi:hypothetical protein